MISVRNEVVIFMKGKIIVDVLFMILVVGSMFFVMRGLLFGKFF